MLKVERAAVMNLENAIRGARNPFNSWDRSDSFYDENGTYVLGQNDLDLASRLAKAGSDHRKFLRQIFVSVDITAPLYWWKEATLSSRKGRATLQVYAFFLHNICLSDSHSS